VFRIDHYLGKLTVQNLLVFRFANALWEPVWNRGHIDHVQITVSEEIGVGSRGEFYESAGALRDMVQNHMLQLLALVAMEPPGSLDADSVRDEKVKVLRAMRPVEPSPECPTLVRGQYASGIARGKPVPAYRQEPKVAADSTVETFAAVRLLVDNWRWAGVPFYLRTGKRMARRLSQIVIQFRCPPSVLFQKQHPQRIAPNSLVLQIQPDEGIALEFNTKVPTTLADIRGVDMDFTFGEDFGSYSPEAYEFLKPMSSCCWMHWRVMRPCSRGVTRWRPPGRSSIRSVRCVLPRPIRSHTRRAVGDPVPRTRCWRLKDVAGATRPSRRAVPEAAASRLPVATLPTRL
jgi:glucose-6-phosphate 1-dehydrogenase